MQEDRLSRVTSRQKRRLLTDVFAVAMLALGLTLSVAAIRSASTPVATAVTAPAAQS